MDDIVRRLLSDEPARRDDLRAMIELKKKPRQGLVDLANIVRRQRFGNKVRLCSIVPGKLGGCSGDCKWCAQSARLTTTVTKPSRTPLEDILSAARSARQLGSSNIGIVNSGLQPSRRDLDDVQAAVAAIRREPGESIVSCASLGILSREQAVKLKQAGLRRYHHNLETSRNFFPKMVSTHDYDGKLATLRAARGAGLEICSGGLFGLGESWSDRLDLAFTLRDGIHPDTVPLNFLCPIPGTPLENAAALQPMEILQIIAVFRLVLPDADIMIAGGREANLRDMQGWIFYAGATSCMIGNYLTTAGRTPQEDLKMLKDLELEVVSEFFDIFRMKNS